MTVRHFSLGSLGLVASWLCADPAFAQPTAPTESRPRTSAEAPFRTRTASSMSAAQMIPLDSMPPALRDRIRKVVNQPTLVTHSEAAEFKGSPKMYEWLLDHPDRAVLAWQRVGVECAPIADRGNGRFAYTDEEGSEIVWHVVANGPAARIWYAEGQIRAGRLTPLIPVKAVVVLRHTYTEGGADGPKIQHQVDVFAQADSRAANIVTHLFGATADRMAEHGAEQMLTFFSALSKYFANHPDRAEKMLAPKALSR
jgi:hypothetical protein